MSFVKIQKISPLEIGCPEVGFTYFGRDEIGLWEKYSDCTWDYITTGLTTGGYSGTSGSSGKNGIDGSFFGTHGTSGTSGISGTSGTSGKTGSSGITGTSGTSGKTGTSGTSAIGSSGISGSSGKTGTSGSSGFSGSSGKDGTFFGSSGFSGGYGGSTRRWYGNIGMPGDRQVTILSSDYVGNYNFSIANTMRIHKIDADLQDLTFWISSWSDGILKIEDRMDLGLFGIYRVSPISIPIIPIAGYVYEIPMTVLAASNSNIIQNKEYLVSFIPAVTGITGESGTSGISGTSGVSGTSGTSGKSGSSGIGTSGSSGVDGNFYGSSGKSGTSGINGTSGNSGTSGTSGSSGKDATSGSSGTAGSSGFSFLIDDISFEFRDIIYTISQTYDLDIKASYEYNIYSACLETDTGTLTGVTVKINNIGVTSLINLTADTSVDETLSTGLNSVNVGDRVTISTGPGYTGMPTVLRGKIKIVRV